MMFFEFICVAILVGVSNTGLVKLNADEDYNYGDERMDNNSSLEFERRLEDFQDDEQKKEQLTLHVIDAEPGSDEMTRLCKFHGVTMVTMLDYPEENALGKLWKESCDNPKGGEEEESHWWQPTMCGAFNMSFEKENNHVDGLSRAQCIAVTMYTTSKFHRVYNEHVRNGEWERYKVFTSLLQSAIVKLDELFPLPENTVLYRGQRNEYKSPESQRIYFKQFVSMTLNRGVAEMFGSGTLIQFIPSVPVIAARIQNLSMFPGEEEVLISPFEAFEFVGRNGSVMYFKSSDSQEILKNELECFDLQDRPGWNSSGLDQRLQDLPTEEEKVEALTLQVFNPGTPDMTSLCQWYGMTAVEVDEATALEKLWKESCNITEGSDDVQMGGMDYYGSLQLASNPAMCGAFRRSNSTTYNNVEGLTRAQCISVTMYTSHFYSSYNRDIRNGDWTQYKVFTSLLHSAIVKLDQLYPIPEDTILYRGMRLAFKSPESKRIYFKQFVSTSSSRRIAQFFGTTTFIQFLPSPSVPILAARIQNLSMFPMEEEVLISPFEAFEFVGRNGSEMYFKSSGSQGILDDEMECIDINSSDSSFNYCVSTFALLQLMAALVKLF